MIIEYHRPDNLAEALALLARSTPRTLPLAGGSWLNRPSRKELAVVDLQALGLDRLQIKGKFLHVGAMVTLARLLDRDEASEDRLPPALAKAIRHEATYNLRQVATIAGTLVAASGRSPLTAALLALDASLHLLPEDENVALGEVLPLRDERLHGRLITEVTIPLNARLAYHYTARTPADQPILCVAAAAWPSGRVRLAVGGFSHAPTLAFDGTESAGAELAARSACSQAQDEWASAEYRQEIAGVLASRCLAEL